MDCISVTPLGISAGTPTRDRNVASFLFDLDGRSILFDCGEGTQHRLISHGWKPAGIDAIFISHLHGDHLFGLPGLLSTMSMMGRERELQLYGPAGIESLIATIRATSQLNLGYELRIEAVEDGSVLEQRGYRIEAALLDHSIPCFGYAFIEDEHRGKFDIGRAGELGVPEGPLLGRLQRGEDVVVADRVVKSSEVMGPARPGRKIVYCTDTRKCDAAVRLASEADLLIHEATYGDDMEAEAAPRFHATARQAAEVARDAQVSRLMITHFSPRYAEVEELVEQARAVFEHTIAARELEPVVIVKR